MKFIKGHPIEIAFCAVFIILSAIVSLQFLEGSNVNYEFSGHDEYLTVREVYSILNPPSFRHFFMAIVSGDILFYGRMTFYVDAIFALLPFKIWGITGMVYAIRMTHVLFLMFGVVLISGTFLKNLLGKGIALIGILVMYYTTYFVLVPKPEPLQLFLLAIFFVLAKRRNWAFGWHFIFVGMAYGVKFNVLLVLPLFFLLPFINGNKSVKNMLVSLGYFIGGVLIAVPCLLLAPFKPVFMRAYLAATFSNTEHYDDTGVSIATWIEKGWFDTYMGGVMFGLVACLVVVWMLVLALRTHLSTRKINDGVIMVLSGLCFLVPVILLTKRMWPHYLWTGNLLLLFGLVICLEETVFTKRARIIYVVALFVLCAGMIKASFQIGQPIFSLEERKSVLVDDCKKAYVYVAGKKSKFVCVHDLSVYYPFKEFLETDRYHPFATPYPFPVPDKKYIWSPFVNPEILREKRADFLLVHSRDFENAKVGNRTSADAMVSRNDSLLRSELGRTLLLDTVFGKVRVYSVNNGHE